MCIAYSVQSRAKQISTQLYKPFLHIYLHSWTQVPMSGKRKQKSINEKHVDI